MSRGVGGREREDLRGKENEDTERIKSKRKARA
jgi:hypothetical protein